MNFYTRLCADYLFPLHEALKKHDTVNIRRDMEKTQWLTAAEIKQLQLQKLRAFLSSINQHVPYYRQLFATVGFNPHTLESLEQLAKLPLLDKATIRAHTDTLKADKAQSLARFNTGGSSGEPLVFYIGKQRVSHDVAAKWRATRWWDVDIGDVEAVIWGSPIELGNQDRLRLWRDRIFRSHLLPAFEMSPTKLDGFIQQLQHVRPKMLFGYPSALALIASHAQQQDIHLDQLGIKVAFVTSECLYDHQRTQIESVFGCPVANGYGGRDAGFIAHQCPSGNMHITAEDLIVEIIDPQGQVLPFGQSGEIVVTHLATSDFPFLRYRTGDIGILNDKVCACGRGLPLLQEIQGRSTDFVVAQDGTVLHGLALIYVLRDIDTIAGFKIIQHNLNYTCIQIIKGKHYRLDIETTIIDAFKKRLGRDVAIEIEYVDSIAKERSGKFRYVISHVPVH